MVLTKNKLKWAASGLLFFISLILFFNNDDSTLDLEVAPTNQLSENEVHEQVKEKGDCIKLRQAIKSNNPIKKLPLSHSQVFQNIHMEVDEKIYRTRFFYEDGDEKAIATYIVYEEDKDGFPLVVEQSAHTPGSLFKEISNSKVKKILYTEEGVVNSDEDTFYHLKNDQIIQVQSDNFFCNF